MRISARIDLVFRDGDEPDLQRIASRVALHGGEVRWRTGENDSTELHARLRTDENVRGWLAHIADNYVLGV